MQMMRCIETASVVLPVADHALSAEGPCSKNQIVTDLQLMWRPATKVLVCLLLLIECWVDASASDYTCCKLRKPSVERNRNDGNSELGVPSSCGGVGGG